jgi:hypothetical protein
MMDNLGYKHILRIFNIYFSPRQQWLRERASILRYACIAYFMQLRGGANKSSARLTSRCRMTKSIVLSERGVCSGAELQVFSCYRR